MISDEDKEKVRQATDFVQLVGETVELRQRGQEFWGCCPFHGEKSPSFKVNPGTGLWHCFGCGQGGDVFSYVQKRENLDFPDAIRYLAERAGIELSEERGRARGPKKSRLVDCLCEAEKFYSTMLMRGRGEGPDSARAYFAGRGFGADVCRRWGLGYAPGRGALVSDLRAKGFSASEIVAADLAVDRRGRPSDRFYERVMFPIHDEFGRTIAFGGRVIGPKKDTAKYVNTRDTQVFNKGKHLFAYDRAKETMAATGEAIVCEGYTDVISMHEHGFTNAVAALGTAFRLDHVKLMERQRVNRIVCMFDGDAAGQRAAERAIQFLPMTKADMRCVVLPDGMDPMEYLAAHDASEMRARLDEAVPLMNFVFEKRLSGADLGTPGARGEALRQMAQVLAPLKGSVVLSEYALALSGWLHVTPEEAKAAILEAPMPRYDEPDAGRSGARGPQVGRSPQAGRGAGQGRIATAGAQVRAANGQWGSRASGGAAGGSAGFFANPAPSAAPETGDVYDYVPLDAYEGAPVPEDDVYGYVPDEAAYAPAAPAAPRPAPYAAPVSRADAKQLTAERELLCALAQRPDDVRAYADRIAGLDWADSANESMAWAMLSTPAGSTPAEVVAAATTVDERAPQALSGGRVISEDASMPPQLRIELLVDECELCSCRRRIDYLKSQLSFAPEDQVDRIFREANELGRRKAELEQKIRSSGDPTQ